MLLNKVFNPLDQCNLKFGETGVDAVTNGLFDGYASTFGNIDTFGDTIMAGAFTDTIKDRTRPVKMFYGHSIGRPIGKWLSLEEDDTGLFVQGELTPNHTDASNVYASMKHGAIDGLSIGFRLAEGDYEDIDGGGRRINKISQLVEISVVSMPAEDTARVGTVKSIADEISTIESIRDVELFLRDAGGFPRSMAKAFISQCRPLYQREVDNELERKEVMKRDLEWLHNLTD